MGNSGWTNDQTDNLVVPPGAGPGDARIVIGPELPPPLDTYVPSGRFPTATGFAGAIIFYSEGDDTTYIYMATVEDAGPPEIAGVVFGFVINGVIQEMSPGFPMSLTLDSNTGSASPDINLEATGVLARTTGNMSLITLAGPAALALSYFNGLSDIRLDGIGIRITTTDPGDDIILDSVDTVQLVAGTDVIITATGDDVVVTAADDILLDGADIIVDGALHWRTGGGSDAVSVEDTQNGAMSGTDVGYVSTMNVTAGTVCGVAFVAPPSGKVLINWRAGADNTTAAGVAFCSIYIKNGAVVDAGTNVQVPSDSIAIQHEGTSSSRQGTFDLVTGLTGGNSYNVTLYQKSSAAGNTAAFADRSVSVVPVL